MQKPISESDIESAALDIFSDLGYVVVNGPDIAPPPEGITPERKSYSDVILFDHLRRAIKRLNPDIPKDALEEATKKALRADSFKLILNNQQFHRSLVNGIDVEYKRPDGSIAGDKAWLIDFAHPENNEFFAVNQFTIIENNFNRRPDILLFVNGIPLVAIELKNPADQDATIWAAFNQFETYKQEIPSLFNYNEILVISDGTEARAGTVTSNKERFMPWKTVSGTELAPTSLPQMEILIEGMFTKRTLLDLIQHFIVFDDEEDEIQKKLAAYHQYHAVNNAVDSTIKAAHPEGDKRCGVVWHTQGSGKSLTMAFYAGKLVLALENPTIVVITDRNDLDDQLFGTFSSCRELLRQTPVQATSRNDLKERLNVAAGGVVFTTIQKFFPEEKGDRHPVLSDRRNIVVIADEAHRSQYDFIDGFAKHMRDALPKASFIGFTGTPIEKADANTRAVFGDYISIYDIQRAVEDKATVPIFYESRLAKLELKPSEKPTIDLDFEDATEGEELEHKEKLKSKWAALEAVVGADKRVGLIAEDLIKHWEARLEVMDGKAMIVCMSRRICFELYEAIRKLRPKWHHKDDEKGVVKIVMTGSASDPLEWQDHIRNKPRREALAKRFKKGEDPFKIVIVRDMWLTGFDAPCLHTMYLDKPMRSHGLMQTIARVNRVFKDKPGGLVVDYLGLAHELKQALAIYTESGGHGRTAIDQEEAVAVMLEKYEICCDHFHGFDWSKWTDGKPAEKLGLLPAAQEYIYARAAKAKKPDEHKQKFLRAVTELSQAFALSVPHIKAIEIRDDVGFFQAVRAAIAKSDISGKDKSPGDIDAAIRQIISRAVASDEVVDIFAAAGLKKPDISILSDDFLAEVRGMPQKNLAVELLRKLLNNEIKLRSKKFLIQSKSFAELLENSIRKYQNRAIETAQVIEELIQLAKDMRKADTRGKDLGLSQDEVAFYDALETNDSAVKALGDKNLKFIAQELVKTIRENVSIDWTAKESVRAKLRVMVKRILRKYGYPPDKQEKATQTVLQQAELLCADWTGSI